MTIPSDSELHQIVERVVRRTMRQSGQAPLGPLPDDAVAPPPDPAPTPVPSRSDPGSIAIGADHGGYQLKEALKRALREQGYNVIDCGTHSADSVDYPDFAAAVARLVSEGEAWRGIVIDGAGIGSCMVANKFPGVRAAMCYDHATALNSREHNNANVLTLGAGLLGPNLAQQIVNTWLTTEFSGGRHARRVDKITAFESEARKSP
ncbi:MAG: ribose 5-phosphate isomerase B [Anaerolineales bacterium]|nr:ribose 5-phosphate isomerase B [Anaerolineales bacterium]